MNNKINLNGIEYTFKETFDVNLIATYENDKWNAWEIVREFLSNSLDSVNSDISRIDISHSQGNYFIHDFGPGYPIFYAERIGASCKRSDPNSIGQFGEGIKLAILTCVRNNLNIMLASENWLIVPFLKEVDGQDVLFYDIYESTDHINGSIVIIEGTSNIEQIFNNLGQYFLVYNNDPALFGNMMSGIYPKNNDISKLYNKGVYIQDINALYSYAVSIENINRDRNIISTEELCYKISDIFENVSDESLLKPILNISDLSYQDKKNLLEHQSIFFSSYPDAWRDAFEDLYGSNSLMSTNEIASREAECLGYNPVRNIDYSVCKILRTAGVKEDTNCLSDDYEFVWAETETLTKSEKEILDLLPKYAQLAGFNDLPETIKVFSEYKNHDNVNGCYNSEKQEIYIRKDILSEGIDNALKTFLHEANHHATGFDDLHRGFAEELCFKLTEILLKYSSEVGTECQVLIPDNVIELPDYITLSAKDLTAYIMIIGNDLILSIGRHILKTKLSEFYSPTMYKSKIILKHGKFNIKISELLKSVLNTNCSNQCIFSYSNSNG